MKRALELARKGTGMVSPNPLVGACIVSSDNQCLSSGYHQHYGGPHAEVVALQGLPKGTDLSTARMYVTLEPCNHTGKTPPCTQAILNAGIRQVIIGCADSADHGSETGLPFLKRHGVTVEGPILEQECLWLNRRFFTAQKKNRPYIILKWAETADGFIARDNGDSKWISGEESRTLVHQWRAEEDCIMVGTRTAERDNPQLTVRHLAGRNPARVVLDRTGRLPSSLHLFDGTVKTYVIQEQGEHTFDTVQYCHLSFDQSLLQRIGKFLCTEGYTSLFVEGGSHLLNSFLEQGLWDELRVFQGKTLFGQGLKAPSIPEQALCYHQEQIAEDQLSYYGHPDLQSFLQTLQA